MATVVSRPRLHGLNQETLFSSTSMVELALEPDAHFVEFYLTCFAVLNSRVRIQRILGSFDKWRLAVAIFFRNGCA